jgi:phosphate transport system protein
MKTHFQRDMERLERDILYLGSLVEQATNKAILAFTARRPELAEVLIAADDEIDLREVQIEDECLKVLALHQPVAGDLRYLISAIKVNTMLERMGDLAVNIAERALSLAQLPPLASAPDLQQITTDVRQMVKLSLDALVQQDTKLAREICEMDDAVDEMHHGIIRELRDLMAADSSTVERALHYLIAARNLERIADHAVNIAQDVVFMVDGQVIRHGPKDNH